MKVAKLTSRQKVIFGYSGVFCAGSVSGVGYFVYKYFFDSQYDVARDKLHTREAIVGRGGMKRFTVSTYAAGHGGLRWRNKPLWFHMNKSDDFPKNGEVVLGSECDSYPGWIKVWDRPFWLPVKDDHFEYLTPIQQ